MGLKLEYKEGQTPLSEEDRRGLLIPSITTQRELNELEQKNISNAIKWTIVRKVSLDKLLTETYLMQLHKRMFGEVWKWAGELRTKETNIGIEPHRIPLELRKLLEDTRYWIEHKVYKPVGIAIRFKHSLVSIHCFPNGNGRHSRLMADLIMEQVYNKRYFSWGGSNLVKANVLRKKYIAALRKADNGDFKDLMKFAES